MKLKALMSKRLTDHAGGSDGRDDAPSWYLVAEIATALAPKNYQIADRKFQQVSDLVTEKYAEHRTIDLQIMHRIITDVLYPEIQERVPHTT